MAALVGAYYDPNVAAGPSRPQGVIPNKYMDMGDGTWALKTVAVNPDGTNIGGGGGGGGVVQQGARDATAQNWFTDPSDRAARLVGVVYGSQAQQVKQTATNFNLQVEIAVGGTLVDPRSIRTLTSSDVVDVADRAARLVGVVYGSQAQQLKQTATNFNAQVEVAVGGTLIDPRSIRTLTTSDTVTVVQPTSSQLNAVVIGQGTDNSTNSSNKVSTIPARANAAEQVWTEGNQVPLSVTLAGRLRTTIADWLGSTAPTIGSKTSVNSIPVVIASDQADVGVKQATAANLNVREDTSGATAAAVPTRADFIGGLAKTAMPTAVADGQLVGALMDKYGRVTIANAPEDLWGQGRLTLTTTTSTAILAAAGAGIKWAVTDISVTITTGTAAVRVDILDGATLIHSYAFVETAVTTGEPRSYDTHLRMPYKGTANTAVNVQLSAAVTDVRVVLTAFKTIL